MTRFGFALLVGAVALASACGPGDAEFTTDEYSDDARDEELRELAAALGSLDMHNLLSDEDMAGYQWVTIAQVQSFLSSKGSFLAGYTDPTWNKSAARLIVERSRAYGINPVYMLARIETESGLVRSKTSKNLAAATGCGCPDGSGCNQSYAGFGNQVECSAAKFRGYLGHLESGGSTITGWKKGVTKKTLDNCYVKPANNATAALYTYTPWVGAYASQCGTSQWGGSSLVALLYKSFKSASVWGTQPPPQPPAPPSVIVVDSNQAKNNAAVAKISVSSNWTGTSSTAGYFGTGYYYASVAAVSDAADFWFYLPEAGTRTIDAWWTSGSNRSTQAPFIAENAAGVKLKTVLVNQQVNGGKWNQLGTFQFTKGWNRIRLSRWASNGSVVIADAVRIR